MDLKLWLDTLGHSNIGDVLWAPNAKNVAVVGDIEGTTQVSLLVLATDQFKLVDEEPSGILMSATVFGTQLEGLPLYSIPGGELIGILDEGTSVSILAEQAAMYKLLP